MPSDKQLPPPNLPIPEFRTPNSADVFVRILVDRESDLFRLNDPLERGTLYSSLKGGDIKVAARYPLLYFLTETVPIGSNTVAGMTQQSLVIWDFMTVPEGESTYNAEISLLADATTNPVYARVYTVRRKDYEADPFVATGTPLTALLGARVVQSGRDYTKVDFTLRGPGEDSGAVLTGILKDGELTDVLVEVEGEGFDVTSFVDVIGDGTGAQIELFIQPAEAILTSQKKVEFPTDDPRQSEFIKVLKVWEVLPGPWIPFTRYDDDLGPIQGRRRAILNAGAFGGQITPTSKTNYEGRDGSSVVLMQIEENWSDGTGVGFNNPTYPILFWSEYKDERGTVNRNSQIIVKPFFATGSATLTRSGGYLTKTWFEPYGDNPYLTRKFIETWVEVVIFDAKHSTEFGGGVIAVQETTAEPGAQAVDYGLTIIESQLRTKSPHEQTKHNEFLATGFAWPILHGRHTDEKYGIGLDFTKQVIDAGSPALPRSGYRGPFVEDQPFDHTKTFRIITAPDLTTLPGPEAWVTTRPFSLPPTLLYIEAVWGDEISKTAQGRANGQRDPSVSVTVRSGSRGGVIVTSRNGFRGHAKCTVARFFKFGPFTDAEIPSPIKILPSSGSIIFFETESSAFAHGSDDDTGTAGSSSSSAFSNSGGLIGDTFEQRVHETDINDHLVGNFSILNATHPRQGVSATGVSGGGAVRGVGLLGGNGSWSARMEVRVPQSTPTPEALAAQPNQQILVEVELEEWGYGIWIMHCYYIHLAGIAI